MTLRDKVREAFDHDNLELSGPRQEIRVYYMRDPRGVAWVPYGGGPLYGDSAINQAAWLARHIEKYRDCLPKSVRQWRIVFGELNTRTFPGVFYPMQLPAEKAEVVL